MRLRATFLLALTIGALAWLTPNQTVRAATLTVNSIADTAANDGVCTLREAITSANTDTASGAAAGECAAGSGTDTITFSVTGIINLTGVLPDISTNMTIDGPGAALLTVRRDTGGSYRIFNVPLGVTAAIDGLTISNGNSILGGGIRNSGTLTVTNSTLSGNTASGDSGGGIYNNGTLTVTNTTLSGNTATFGGGIANNGTLTLTNSTLSGNTVTNGGGIFNSGTLTLTNSTLSNNSASNNGGGIANAGPLTLTNSTISGNSATSGGGIFNTNSALTLNNTIVANSTSGGDCFLFAGTINAQHSLIMDGLACINGTNNLTGDPLLGALANNGGSVQTHALTAGSPAINAGSPAINAGSNALIGDDLADLDGDTNTTEDVPFDARGVGFARVVAGTVDVGAFELYTPDFVVDRTDDANVGICSTAANDCTLRGAITLANTLAGTDTITFSVTGIINLTGVLPDISTNMTIDGPGAALLTVRRDTGGSYRIFNVLAGVTAAIDGLTISNGSPAGNGGGIRNVGTLTVTNTTVSGNTASNGGGIVNVGTLTVTNTTVSGNSATSAGGGIANNDTLTLINSTFSNNTATIFGGGIVNSFRLQVINSTISGNSAIAYGGGVVNADALTMINTTISGNTVTGSGSDDGGGAIDHFAGLLTIRNSTIVGNTAPNTAGGTRGGVWVETGDIATITNTLLADNGAGNCTLDGTLTAGVDSMSDDATCGVSVTTVSDAALTLPALANNGGSVQTHALLTGSPAINAGSNANIGDDLADLDGDTNTTEDVPFDARGVGFPRVQQTTVDIGAYESNIMTLPGVTISPFTINPVQEGANTSYTIVLTAPPNSGETVTISARGYNGRFITISPTSVQFTNANWNVARTIDIHANNDTVQRGVRYLTAIDHAVSTNGAVYVGVTVPRIRLTILDNDLSDGTPHDQTYYDALNLAAWLDVTPNALAAGAANVGATVRLNGQPMPGQIIIVNLYVGAGVTVSPASITFTEHNWDIAQPVTLIAADAGETALQVVVDAAQTTSMDFIGAAQAVVISVQPAGTSVLPAEQPAAPFVPASESTSGTNEGTVSE